MNIRQVHCLFEQSGTFKKEFIALGIPAQDYDLQNNFGETDHIIDIFAEIENAYGGGTSIFDQMTKDDLIMAFFPCIHFCDAKTLFFKGVHIGQKNWSLARIMDYNIVENRSRAKFFELWMMLFAIVDKRGLRMIVENPYNSSGMTYLENNFLNPTIIDKNRMERGDYYIKPTGYWFVGFEPTQGYTHQNDKVRKSIMKASIGTKGTCSEERSMISPDYARNFICDHILGKSQPDIQLTLFDY